MNKDFFILINLISGMVSAMDDAIGKIIKKLENTGMLENTIVVFSSDVRKAMQRF